MAGPTGLALAGELRRRGIDCTLIDSLDAPLSWDRATIVHPRTMELFATLGLSDELLKIGVHQRYIYIYSDGARLGEMDLAESGSPFGFNLNVSEVGDRTRPRRPPAGTGRFRARSAAGWWASDSFPIG